MAFEDASKQKGLKGILEFCPDPIVSSDVIHNPASSVFDAPSTMVMQGIGLHAEVTQGKFDLLRYFTWPTQGTLAVCTGGNGKIFVGDAFQFVIGRMKHYPINALSAFIILDQHGSLAVSDLCKFVHPLRRDLAHPAEKPLCPFKILC